MQTLFRFLTGEDLRKLVSPIARENKFSRRIQEQRRQQLVRRETRREAEKIALGKGKRPAFDANGFMKYRRLEQYERVLVELAHVKADEQAAIENSFRKLCANPQPAAQMVTKADLCGLYLTQDSIVNRFHEVFGYRNENLALRLYNVLSDGYNQVHIYLPTFYMKLQGILGGGYPMQLNLFGFKLLDSEQNGLVSVSDITDIITNALHCCPPITLPAEEYPELVGYE